MLQPHFSTAPRSLLSSCLTKAIIQEACLSSSQKSKSTSKQLVSEIHQKSFQDTYANMQSRGPSGSWLRCPHCFSLCLGCYLLTCRRWHPYRTLSTQARRLHTSTNDVLRQDQQHGSHTAGTSFRSIRTKQKCAHDLSFAKLDSHDDLDTHSLPRHFLSAYLSDGAPDLPHSPCTGKVPYLTLVFFAPKQSIDQAIA